ncbi:MAG: hypothetical protein IJW54_03470 [Clostridia bacterium]|nr:hypothetical protein [Clostridia bacterium]
MKIIVEQIKASNNLSNKEIFDIARARLKRTRAFSNFDNFFIYKRSIDARNKDEIKLVYSVCLEAEAIKNINDEFLRKNQLKIVNDDKIDFSFKGSLPNDPPVVVGFGPCGMFSALALARAGLKPVVIERGADVDTRVEKVSKFYNEKILDLNTNIQFGAGGAGTFSDGKLTTGINDPKCSFVLKELYDHGAPVEILYSAKPHIGTDILRNVVKNIEQEIESLGGKIYYNTCLISFENGVAKTTNGEYKYSNLILAIGHSARDTYEYLLKRGTAIEPKPFSVGVRVEHLRADIDEAMYGSHGMTLDLGSASYNISHRYNNKGVYSFCMCPGGEVVAAQSEENSIVVNGMSYNARNGKNSNSAIVVQVDREDYGSSPISAINFQRNIEKQAFINAGSNYSAPMQTLGDFYEEKVYHEPKRIMPSYMHNFTKMTDLNKILPKFVCDYLRLGFQKFGEKIKGFNAKDVPLTGVETRTSAPIRILRGANYTMLDDSNVYPGGEGAGYAGGIMSAAIDGTNIALAIINKGNYEK